jgi:hypothetical protein
MKSKLLIVTGAGSSLDFGMPSVADIDSLFEKWGMEICPLVSNPNKSLYSWVKEKYSEYVKQNKGNRINALVNFESLLYTIQSLSSITQDLQYGNYNHRLNPFIQIDEFPEIINYLRQQKKAESYDFHFLHSHLVDRLLKYFREKCATLNVDRKEELESLQGFLNKLKTQFDIGVVNLNYDNVVLSALPDLVTGFDEITGKFNRDIFYNSGWNFCYHMHGSIHFDMKGGDDSTEMHKIRWNPDLTSHFTSNSSGRSGTKTTEGLDHLTSCIITGLDKSNQILREPFASYFMQLDKLVYEADAILFLGYGFNDMHLNSIFPFIRYDKAKIRKVVIVDWATPQSDGLNYRHDDWSYGVFSTIPYNGFEMGDGTNREPKPVIHFKKRNTLEKSRNPELPLAIWYNGMTEACKNAETILMELL